MIESEALQMLVYQHVVQLTLLDHTPRQAFKIAHMVAALAFDEAFTSSGLEAARAAIASTDDGGPSVGNDHPKPKPKTEPKQGDMPAIKRPEKASS